MVAEEHAQTVRMFNWITSYWITDRPETVRMFYWITTGSGLQVTGLQVQTVRIFYWITSYWITDRPDFLLDYKQLYWITSRTVRKLSGLLTGLQVTGLQVVRIQLDYK